MAITSIRFEAVGDHIEVKIGAHCRAQLSLLEEELLWDWLTDRMKDREITPENPTVHYLELPARNGA